MGGGGNMPPMPDIGPEGGGSVHWMTWVLWLIFYLALD